MLARPSDPSLLHIRPLTAADTNSYRALRQRILKTSDARYFSDSYIREAQLTHSQWLEWCAETQEHCILGTFAKTDLVGIMMITRQGGPESPVVEWEATWLDPAYRGIGIGRLAYAKAMEWSQNQGYKFVVGFIRADNTTAPHICKNQGFTYAYTIKDEVWADGTVADTNAYLLNLEHPGADLRQQRTLKHLEKALVFLNQGAHAPPKEYDGRDRRIVYSSDESSAHKLLLR